MTEGHADAGRLIDYLGRRLPADESAAVARHLEDCAECAREGEAWRAVSLGTRRAAAAVSLEPRSDALTLLLGRVANDPRRTRGRLGLGHAAAVLAGQVPLVRRRIWAASVVMLALGTAIAVTRGEQGGVALALAAPLVAALGVVLIYGPEVDPAAELVAAAITPIRLILIARLVLVAGFDLLLTVAASGLVATVGGAHGLWVVVSGWLGPFALLCSLSLLLAVWWGPSLAAFGALAVWSLDVLARAGDTELLSAWQAAALAHLWTTSAGVLAVAGTLFAAAVFLAPYRMRLA
ncbi:MAG: anti-sigma factor family protein [Trebonia sp.]